jgi:hypothetical protein
MPAPQDDLEAVRSIVQTLEPFDKETRERVVRWVLEKLGMKVNDVNNYETLQKTDSSQQSSAPQKLSGSHHANIKTFVSQKNPASDTHFAATVAYFYRFVAPEGERKDSISKDDLLEACRKADRNRINYPIQTLGNAFKDGLLDKAGEPGKYKINTVGENLVAMTLPSSSTQKTPPRNIKSKKIKKATKPKK